MSRPRQSSPDDTSMIRISQTIRGNKHPEIADLYRDNHDGFASTVCDALTVYALLLRKTGARSAAEVMGALGGLSVPERAPHPQVQLKKINTKIVDAVQSFEDFERAKAPERAVPITSAQTHPVVATPDVLTHEQAAAALAAAEDL